MQYRLQKTDRVGFIRPFTDAHSLGLATVAELLTECGIYCRIAEAPVCQAVEALSLSSAVLRLRDWILGERLTVIGFSYRLDAQDGLRFLAGFMVFLRNGQLLSRDGGPIKAVYFGGLPPACEMVAREFPEMAGIFQGDETISETFGILGLDLRIAPPGIEGGMVYDEARLRFGRELIKRQAYRQLAGVGRRYPFFGTAMDSLAKRLDNAIATKTLPLTRVHVGPYTGDIGEDFKTFLDWAKQLAASKFLDVLSIGTSQLTQSHFYRDRGDLPDGGGVSIRSPLEFSRIWEAARPMLVRTYAGSADLARLAQMYDETINMAWHTLSFWWFCQIDGRGPNPLLDNLREHFATLAQIAAAGKPFEANVPHHFAFRGADDVSYIVSGFLAAKAAKLAGVKTFVLQVMLNTPKASWGIQDLAKAQSLLALVKALEDGNFRVVLQPRGGLDYFSPDLEKAKAQLAAVTAMMDDIEPGDDNSPQVIHVVSYSEAVRLADPQIINESIQITRQALIDYRQAKARGEILDISRDPELASRRETLLADSKLVIAAIEQSVPNPYSAEGFYRIIEAGFLPIPHLWECREELCQAVRWATRKLKGGVAVVDEAGNPIPTSERIGQVLAKMNGKTHG